MSNATKTNAITSSLTALAATKAVTVGLPKIPKASGPTMTTKPLAKPLAKTAPPVITKAAWLISLDRQVASYCVGSETMDSLVEQIRLSITGQTRDDVRQALLSAVSSHYDVLLVVTKSPKKSEAGRMVLDSTNKAYERANKRLQRLVMTVLPAEITVEEVDETEGEELCKKESLPLSAQQKTVIEAIDTAVAKAGFTDTKKDKALLIAALKVAIAAYK